MLNLNGKEHSLALHMIVKDEVEDLSRCLKNCGDLFDEIVIGWNGGDKDMRAFLEEQCKDKRFNVFEFEWDGNFSYARNLVLDKVTSDFVMWLDSDDTILNPEVVKEVIEKSFIRENVGSLWSVYLYDFDEDGNCIDEIWRERIVRRGWFRWDGELHECMMPVYDSQIVMTDTFKIKHNEKHKRVAEKASRNLKIIADLYQRQVDEKRVDPKVVMDLARSLQGLNMLENAVLAWTEFIKGTQTDDHRAYGFDQLGYCYTMLKKYDLAIECFLKEEALKPYWPDPYFGLGTVYYYQEKYREAITAFRLSLQLPPRIGHTLPNDPAKSHFKPMRFLAFSYFYDGDFEKSVEYCNRTLKYNPSYAEVLKLRDYVVSKIKERDFADMYLAQMKELEKTDTEEKLKYMALSAPSIITNHPAVVRVRNKFSNIIKNNRVVIYCGPTKELWSPISTKTGIGGSEEAVINMAKELSRLGYYVDVYCDCDTPGLYEGAVWHQYESYLRDEPCDIFIAWRGAIFIDFAPKDSRVFLWIHDVQKQEYYTPARIERVEKIMALSKFHRTYIPFVPEEKIFYTTNGINPEHFNISTERNPDLFVYASSPDRGLNVVLNHWMEIRKHFPKALLNVLYGFTVNFDDLHKNNKVLMDFKRNTMAKLKELEDNGVIYRGRVGHLELADIFCRSAWWFYPSGFPEVSCITAMKAQAAGAWPICSTVGALPETVKFGNFLEGDFNNDMVQDGCIKNVLPILEEGISPEKRQEMMDYARENFSWKKVAEKWHDLFSKKQAEKELALK